MRLYNTLSRRLEPVRPRDGAVSLYVCGITPYDVGHLGHALTYLTYDVIRRRLESEGVRVRHIQNITDVDDDIIRKARELETTPEALTERNVAAFDRDMLALNALPAHEYPKVSTSMPAIIAMVERLVAEGYAYEEDGAVYFSVARYPAYGQLCGRDRAWMLGESARQKMRPGPRDPLDFLLWQAQAPGEPAWPSPWGPGRPGWHIECSAMAVEQIGAGVTIHGGGADLIYPHHESETAQSESATGVAPFVEIWAHIGMLRYGGEKMSKSLGNLVLAKDLLRRYTADAVRLALYSQHYRIPWEYDDSAIERGAWQAATLSAALACRGGTGPALDVTPLVARAWELVDTDLRLPETVDTLLALAGRVEGAAAQGADVAAAQDSLRAVGAVLGLTFAE